ncbi:putative ribosome quality control (RQC) complex YloA/Tae2 family protein [Paenibacillus endophyticus]|uniref:Rqc2 homolog RqcH n=1 Tax=Paenibacillus endophyticus TaxID=1294268 RepID=A0A7W5C7N2_9BACL|nr:NFACT RNA binding domain-containing protein [Paenibacillus endophyticus]MBB3152234.1 putative ribosome quality control (RQC) complex YloA/Tae2 family protein [Paenibacillus endophyticus]
MALDGIVTHAITQDLQRCIGARIHKIHQPTNHELVFSIRGAGMQGKLLLSANPTYPRVHWTTGTYVNPMEAPMFCMLLRKHCEGGLIESIRQVGRERIIHIEVKHRDELGDLSNKTIIVEIMGRHSNIILMDPATGMIHDGIHHVTPAISSHRIVLPGSTYTSPPEQGKIDPLTIETEQAFLDALSDSDEEAPLYKRLVEKLSGFSPLLAKELVHRAHADQDEDAPHTLTELWNSYNDFIQQVKSNQFTPTIKTNSDTGKSFFSITELTHIEGEAELFPDISACLEGFYGNKAERDTVKQRAADLIRFVQNEKAKNITKIKKLEDTLVEAKDAEKFRVLGELLTAYMHQIKRGDTFIELINFYDEEQAVVKIDLDPQLTPSDNAQRYFRRYTKHKNSLSIVAEQMELARTEIAYFESLLQQVDNASLGDIGEIRDELVEQGYMKERGRRGPKKKKVLKPTLLCFTSSEGAAIFVGKNNTQNEYLTNRLASPSDTWLHTKDIPGSHVVIRGGDFGNATLEEAAMLSAHYSQARDSSSIPVDYTTIRHVRKPNGAKPGFVIYDNQKTLFVTPDERRIKSLPCVLK